jgi:hypothetical protein
MTDGELPVASVMLEEDLVVAGVASEAELSFATAVHAELAARFGMPLYARIDLLTERDGKPVVSELELIEPSLYLASAEGAAARFARAVLAS